MIILPVGEQIVDLEVHQGCLYIATNRAVYKWTAEDQPLKEVVRVIDGNQGVAVEVTAPGGSA